MRILSSFVALLLAASAAGAQTITGRVTDRTSGFPVAGVVVSALDAGGAPLARTVTDSASGYRVPLIAGAVKLHFRRIGYSPAEVAIADSVNGRIDVTLSRLPTVLPPVKAMAAVQCDGNANGPEVLALWEEVRSGLLTSMVAREAKAVYASVLAYQTGFDGDDERPRVVERIELPPGVTGAFIAGSDPATLARDGYVVREGFSFAFLGPDDRVLFDETFLTTNCFTLEQADSLVGIHFEPGKGRKVSGVTGTTWLRRDPLELVKVEYTYTNIDRAIQRAKPGGAIQFRRMPNGITMISDWRIRSAAAVVLAGTSPRAGTVVGRAGSVNSRRMPRGSAVGRDPVATASETGAVIELMQWPDVPPYVAKLGSISGRLIDKFTKKPLPNTPIRFHRTPFATTTDSAGAFRIIDVLPGLYELDSGDPELAKFGVAGELFGPVAVKYGENSIDVQGEGPEAVIARGCGEKVDGRIDVPGPFAGKGAIFGVIQTNRRPAKEEEFRVEILPKGAVPGTPALPMKGKTDKAGHFRVCGMPHGTAKVIVQDKAFSGLQEVVMDSTALYRLVHLKAVPKGGP